MDLKSGHSSPVLTGSVPVDTSRLGLSSILRPYSPPSAPYSSGMSIIIPRRSAIPGTFDVVHGNGWLDAMASSSPPCKKVIKDSSSLIPPDGTDVECSFWMSKCPSALTAFDQITSNANGKHIALFLDYDGTLSPIVDNPDLAVMSPAMRSAVQDVAKYFPTAIVSGRSRDKVFEFVGLTELYYAGSHGMDIMGPVRESSSINDHPNCIRSTDNQGKEVNLFQPANEFSPVIDKVFRSLIEISKAINGVRVENNKFCVSVHYRLVDPERWHDVASCVENVLMGYSNLCLTHGRKVLEIRPVIDWNKGKAVEFLLDSLGLSNSADVLPMYVGDDATDEDAFKVLKEGNRGLGIVVSSKPKETNAFYSLRDPSEVMEFLKSLVSWKKSAPLPG